METTEAAGPVDNGEGAALDRVVALSPMVTPDTSALEASHAQRLSPAAERVMSILTFLGRHPDERFTMSALARELKMNKATAHTLLLTLTARGFLLRHPTEKTYRLGPALVALGESAVLDEREAADFAHAEMRAVSEELGMMCVISAAVGEEIVILSRVDPHSRIRGFPRPGQRLPFAAPVGAVYVAWSPPGEVQEWLERGGPKAVAAADYYTNALREIRERGFAVNLLPLRGSQFAESIVEVDFAAPSQMLSASQFDHLFRREDGDPAGDAVVSLIAPAFHADGRVLLALTLEAPIQPGDDQNLLAHGRRLLDAAARVTESIHGVPPRGWPRAD
jgi:DNA-binding IclR family transcriptional regulator